MGVVEVSGESTRLFMPSERKMSKLSVKAILCHLERGEERERGKEVKHTDVASHARCRVYT